MNALFLDSARHRMTFVVFVAGLAMASTATAQTLPHGVPDFCASYTITSISSGASSNHATWSPGRIPAAGDAVRIAAGHVVA